MSDRLNELRRQRALVQQQLDWLDDEIAAASGAKAPSATRPVVPPPPTGHLASQAAAIVGNAAVSAPSPARTTAENPAVAATADAILSEYRVPSDTLKTDIRKGCFLYFFGALGLVAAGVTALYFLLSNR